MVSAVLSLSLLVDVRAERKRVRTRVRACLCACLCVPAPLMRVFVCCGEIRRRFNLRRTPGAPAPQQPFANQVSLAPTATSASRSLPACDHFIFASCSFIV